MKAMETTWEPSEEHGRLSMRSDLPDTVFAFPRQRKEPLTDAKHVRNAVARFDQVIDASDGDRALAFANIEKAARHYGVDLSETDWHQLGVHPQRNRKEAAAKAVETKRERGELADAAARAVKTKREHGVLQADAAKAAATRRRKREQKLRRASLSANSSRTILCGTVRQLALRRTGPRARITGFAHGHTKNIP